MSGFAQIPNGLLLDAAVRATGIRLYGCLDYLARRGGEVRASTSQLASMLGKSPSTVRDLAGELKRAGYVEIIPQYDESGNQTINLYRLPHRIGGSGKPAGGAPENRRGRAPDFPQKCNEKLAASQKNPKGSSEALSAAAPNGASPPADQRKTLLLERIDALKAGGFSTGEVAARAYVANCWPDGVPKSWDADLWATNDLDRVDLVITEAEERYLE